MAQAPEPDQTELVRRREQILFRNGNLGVEATMFHAPIPAYLHTLVEKPLACLPSFQLPAPQIMRVVPQCRRRR
jgi:hypothetical protein